MLPLIRKLGFCLFMAGLHVSAAWAVEGDIVFKREAGGDEETPPAVFSHWFHRIRFRCYVCHPAIFDEVKVSASKITMDAIDEGKFCGVCHNGKIAWESSFDTCNRCHVEQVKKGAPQKKGEQGERKGETKKEEPAKKQEPAKKEEAVGMKEPTQKEEPAKKEEPPKKEEQVETEEPVDTE
jgi:c(7)-type cytochrome triheme protein